MRKRNLTNLFDNILWYILYILPVLLYMAWLFIPKDNVESTVFSYTMTKNEDLDTFYDSDNFLSVIPFNPNMATDLNTYYLLIYPENYNAVEDVSSGQLMDHLMIPMVYLDLIVADGVGPAFFDVMASSFNVPFFLSFDYNSNLSITTYTTTSFLSEVGLSNSYDFYSLYLVEFGYDDSLLWPWYVGSVDTQSLIDHFDMQVVSQDSQLGFDYFMNDIGFGFATDNIVVNGLEEIFGANGVMPVFLTNTPIIIFAWFICVFIIHLAVDFLLFIPRLAHKWMNEFGGD